MSSSTSTTTLGTSKGLHARSSSHSRLSALPLDSDSTMVTMAVTGTGELPDTLLGDEDSLPAEPASPPSTMPRTPLHTQDGLLNREFFQNQYKTEEELNGLRKRFSRHLQPAAREGLLEYYREQNDRIASFQEADDILLNELGGGGAQQAADERADQDAKDRFAMNLSFCFNVLLFVLKVVVVVMSGSLSLIASALDSFLDLLSGGILWFTARQVRRADADRDSFPVGKSRMQPLGILVFSCVMGTVGFQVLIEGVRQLIGPSHVHHMEDLVVGVTLVGFVIVCKFCLFLYCRTFESEDVKTYAQDHFNDVITNSIGLACAIAGDRIAFWIDPLGAILLAAHITRVWGQTALENMRSLVGMSAPPRLLGKLTYIAWNAHPHIKQIDTIRAYTFGPKYFVEIDVVLDPSMRLQDAHDIGQELQDRLETLAEVERAFVHLDWETSHAPEHNPFTATQWRSSMSKE
ncbi:hypothetical protein PPROV_000922100 [Pycnococcus provasolii]|uniref:Cation efflux protein cytoplasmic domain-containing protein n=1 Tax=Pycnococcus provasolii TaxID=41880 RepID=A0A830HXG8_9CHLO|nr:hypothetical protein PPROV_000922100 [Pycnococcus provasolii]